MTGAALAIPTMRILLVEDDQDVADYIRRELEDEGHAVSCATMAPPGLAGRGAPRLRHHHSRCDDALHGRAGGHAPAAPRAHPHPDPAADRAGCPRGDRSRAGLGRRRLPHEAVLVRRAAGADPGAHAQRSERRAAAAVRRSRPGSGTRGKSGAGSGRLRSRARSSRSSSA